MACAGLCDRYGAGHLPPPGLRRYDGTRKRCTTCEVFIECSGTRCPCCHQVLRTRPRNKWDRMDLLKSSQIGM